MWLFTNIGFLGVVQKPSEGFLTVRSQVAANLDRLRDEYLPTLSPTISWTGTDYPYRATISHNDFSQGLAAIGSNIDYSNFKNEVAKQMGLARGHAYSKVWSSLQDLEMSSNKQADTSKPKPRSTLKLSYGGVVINA